MDEEEEQSERERRMKEEVFGTRPDTRHALFGFVYSERLLSLEIVFILSAFSDRCPLFGIVYIQPLQCLEIVFILSAFSDRCPLFVTVYSARLI